MKLGEKVARSILSVVVEKVMWILMSMTCIYVMTLMIIMYVGA